MLAGALLLCLLAPLVEPFWRSLDPELRAMQAWADRDPVDPWGAPWTTGGDTTEFV